MERFVAFMNADQPVRPANIANIVAINQGRRPLTMGTPTAPGLAPRQALERIEAGTLVLDARSQADFGASHIPGSFNIQASSSEFEQRVGWVLPADAPFLLLLGDDSRLGDTLQRLAFLGLDSRVAGYVAGGMNAWIRAGLPQRTVTQVSVSHLAEQLRGSRMAVLDVREPDEWAAGHIEGAHHCSYKLLGARLDGLPLEPDQEVSVICAGGLRSSTASSILLREKFERVYNVTGGMTAWYAAGLPFVTTT